MFISGRAPQFASLVLGVVLAANAAPAAPEETDSSINGAFVVLADGTRIDAARVERSGSMIVVTMENGRIVGYDVSDVSDYSSAPAASAAPTAKTGAGTRAPSSLGGYASTIALEVPEEGGLLRGATVGAGSAAAHPGVSGPSPATTAAAAGIEQGQSAVEAAVAELAARLSGFNRWVMEVDRRCSDYSYATTPFGGPFVVHNSYTAHCQDAVRQANTELDRIAARHAEIQKMIRRAGMPPGESRALFRAHGLQNFTGLLAGARRRVTVGDPP